MSNRRRVAKAWEIVGLSVMAVWLALSAYAVLTPWLAGPLFVPMGILLGAFGVYLFGLLLSGVGRDQRESMDRRGIYAPLP